MPWHRAASEAEGIAGAAPIAFALPTAAGSVAGVGPAPGIVVAILRSADVVDGAGICSRLSGTLLKYLPSYIGPLGPPLRLAPLSEISMVRVLSYSPISFRTLINSPMS